MRSGLTSLAMAMLATTALAAAAQAQSSYPCANDLPNPYHQVQNWAQTPRPWAPANALSVDSKNNLWVVDRCEDKGCADSNVAPVFQLSPDGKTMKNFGAGLFVEPHQMAVDADGNAWVADAGNASGKGMQVTKLSPDGKVLLKLGKAAQGAGSSAPDVFDAPTGVSNV